MFSSKTLSGILFGLTVLGVACAAIAGLFGPGFGSQMIADAAPRQLLSGTLGIGERTVAPLTSWFGDNGKIAVVGAELPRTMSRAAVRAEAPLPKPVIPQAPSPSVSRSTASSSGWSTAKVSWYGPGFYGRTTASGAVLVEGMMNVAHRTLPFGTRVQFEYNGRSCTAVVNDRGPYVGDRTFDLGPGTATALGFSGVGTVRYRILGR